MASTTGGYTTTKAKARKPRAFKSRLCGCEIAYLFEGVRGARCVVFHDRIDAVLTTSEIARFQKWLARAAAWCAEGGRR